MKRDDVRKVKVSDLCVEDLLKIIPEMAKSSNRLVSFGFDQICNHLDTSMSDILIISAVLSRYENLLRVARLFDFLKKNQYEICGKFNEDGFRPYPLDYINIEISPGEYVRAVGDGYLSINDPKTGFKFVLGFEDYGVRTRRIKILVDSQHEKEASNFLTAWESYAKENNVFKGKKLTPGFEHIKLSGTYNWDSVILSPNIKKEIQRNVNLLLNNVEIYRKNNLTFKRGLILKGVPGTGKTHVGRVICNTIGEDITFIWVTPGDVNSTDRVKAICELARGTAPSVLFLEDIDLYSKHRDLEPNKGLLGELMNQLDGLIENEFVIIIATTNYPENVEEALRNRPGRFDRIIDIAAPDLECRECMLKLFLRDKSVEVEDFEILVKELAKLTDGFTGAHMKELVNSAVISAIDDESLNEDKIIIKEEHFVKNIELVRTKKITALGFSSKNTSVDYDELDY